MKVVDSFIGELEAEAETTRRVLERVPSEHLGWRPHAKSMSLGQLALHVASLPGRLTDFIAEDELDFATAASGQIPARSQEEVLTALASSVDAAKAYLTGLDDDRAAQLWRLLADGKELFAAPRSAVIRTFLFNHWYHHRGQLLVYLRLLNLSVPAVYGPSADENPFAASI